MTQRFVDTLQKVATTILSADGGDIFDGLSDFFVSEEYPAIKISPTESSLTAKVKNTVREKIAGNPTFVEEAIVQLFGKSR